MSRHSLLLGLALLAAGCSFDFTTPRAWKCSADVDCGQGWLCAGDGYCHDAALGVPVACGERPCPGGWLCGKDLQCHDPAVGRGLPCTAKADCPGGWTCAGDGFCHDPAVGLTVTCTGAEQCTAGWRCLLDGLCHDPAVGAPVRCVASPDCPGGWTCAGDHACHDPAVGQTVACAGSAQCTAGWRCLLDGLCHDPDAGAPVRCVAPSDCVGGWQCTLDGFCRDPALGVPVRCVAPTDCTGAWQCTRDGFCRDPDAGVTVPCAASADCPGAWQCTADHLCHDPAEGVTVPCTVAADCTGGWRCTQDFLCRDPARGAPIPCAQASDCTGGWFCGRDLTCHDPAVPAALSCLHDGQCGGGYRCDTEGACVDAAQVPAPFAGPAPGLVDLTEGVPALALAAAPTTTTVTWYGVPTVTAGAALVSPGRLTVAQLDVAAGASDSRAVSWRSATFTLPPDAGALVVGQAGAEVVAGSPAAPGSALSWYRLDGGVTPLGPVGALTTVRPVVGPGPAAFTLVADGGARVLVPSTGQSLEVFPGLGWPTALADVATTRQAGWDGGATTLASAQGFTSLGVAVSTDPTACVDVYEDLAFGGFSGGPSLVLFRPDVVLQGPDPSRVSALEAACEPRAVKASAGGPVVLVTLTDKSGLSLDVVLRQYTPVCGGLGIITPGQPVPIIADPVFCLLKEGASTFAAACPLGETLLDFDAEPGTESLLLLCASGGQATLYRQGLGDFSVAWRRPRPALVDGRAGGFAFADARGRVDWASSLLDAQPLSGWARQAPRALSVVGGRPRVLDAVGLYTSSAGPLRLTEWSAEPAHAWAGFVAQEPGWLVRADGTVVDVAGGRTPTYVGPVPSSANVCAAQPVTIAGRRGLVLLAGDTLSSGEAAADGGVGTLAVRARPVPGFDLSSAAFAPPDGGPVSGWAVANGRLFQVSGRAVDRWTPQELRVSGREALQVWFGQGHAWLGTSSGEVLALPERVPVAAPLASGQASSLVGHCGTAWALDPDGLWRLEPGDGGVGGWRAVDAGSQASAPGAGLSVSQGRLFLGTAQGDVGEIVTAGCP